MNVPNILSLTRIGMVPLFCVVYFSGSQYYNYYAAGIYALASLTDVLDGYIARRNNLITRLGRILDPMADKLMSMSVLICIVIDGLVPWWAAMVLFVKELLMSIGALVQYKKAADVPPSNIIGKFSTALFFVICLIIMLFPGISRNTASILIAPALISTVVSFIFYLYRFVCQQSDKTH